MSPEQASGRPLDVRTDIYGLGATLFMAATGVSPYHGETPFVTVSNMLTKDVPDVRSVNPQVPAWCASLIGRCLAKDPDQRYQRPSELVADLNPRSASIPRLRIAVCEQQWMMAPWIVWSSLFIIWILAQWKPRVGVVAPSSATTVQRTTRRLIRPPSRGTILSTTIANYSSPTVMLSGVLLETIRREAALASPLVSVYGRCHPPGRSWNSSSQIWRRAASFCGMVVSHSDDKYHNDDKCQRIKKTTTTKASVSRRSDDYHKMARKNDGGLRLE